MTLSIWKFAIGTDEIGQDPDDPTIGYSGIVAAAVAPSADEARAALVSYTAEHFPRLHPNWLRVARVTQLPLEDGVVVVVAAV